ncbi:MAG: hypothetical protein NT092_11535 [Bacteroidia bacterium]|nr:hypothetical protein [Bacteroidia bacterium]
MKARTLLLLIILFSISGCEKIKLGETFKCHPGITYHVTSDLSFKITDVHDSRCPEDMICIWAGECHLDFTIKLADNIIDTLLYMNPVVENPYIFGNYNFSVLDVRPINGASSLKDITIKMLITDY